MSKICVDTIEYKNFGKCVRISNGIIDAVVTVDCGPRIIRYGFVNKENELCDDAPMTLEVEGDVWRLMGGHRFWCSPEAYPRTYIPDNSEVLYEYIEDGVKITQPANPWFGQERQLEIVMDNELPKMNVLHRVVNKSAWPVKLAAWGLTNMAKGGKEIIPIPVCESHYSNGASGAKKIVLWPYGKMNDPRIAWGDRYIIVTHDPENTEQNKFGILNKDGWAAYFNHGNVFIKRFPYIAGEEYPDEGVSFESYLIDFMCEMETLSPLRELAPESCIEHVETWELYSDVKMPDNDEFDVTEILHRFI